MKLDSELFQAVTTNHYCSEDSAIPGLTLQHRYRIDPIKLTSYPQLDLFLCMGLWASQMESYLHGCRQQITDGAFPQITYKVALKGPGAGEG